MTWYLIPIFARVTDAGTTYVPGQGTSVVTEADLPWFSVVLRAHSPKAAPTSALLGVPTPANAVPEGWVPKTPQEAAAHFEAVVGRAPSEQEIY